MKLLDPTILVKKVDYSFGDQSSDVHNLWDKSVKDANINNFEFIELYNLKKDEKKVLTLFIDNIRLYQRKNVKYTNIELRNEVSKNYKDERVKQLSNNDLLSLCSKLTDMKFIIFTGFEDTPTDEEIFDKIPDNVIAIYASNATTFGGKVIPIPYGVQRKLNPFDSRHEILLDLINTNFSPSKLLYINHNVSSNIERQKINDKFQNENWVTIDRPKSINSDDYKNYLLSIKNHKFMICPDGNAIGCECHRDWEVIYMRRVPIVIDSPYLRKIFDGIPVLFVKSFLDINQDLLIKNDFLFQEIQNFDLTKLDFEKIYDSIITNL
jgi:hypothetical protein